MIATYNALAHGQTTGAHTLQRNGIASMTDPMTAGPSPHPPSNLSGMDPEFLEQLRSQMLRFAILQLQDEQQAEDAVQEALAGALKNAGAFNRRAALKTWVFAILKNKITDTLRGKGRTLTIGTLAPPDSSESSDHFDDLFDETGHWHAQERPVHWQQPEQQIENAHFWRVFEACLTCLPEQQSRFFMMREFLELSSDEICHNEQITTSNLHVILYRARIRLRECLENHWFLNGEHA